MIYIFTHDSIGVGEDGPTHQPIEHLASLRAIPNLTVIRPADAAETAVAWQVALERRTGPVALILTRQKVPVLDRARLASASFTVQGAYILAEAENTPLRLILLATGSEVSLTLQARNLLEAKGIGTRVLSMPSWELFAEQPKSYRDELLPSVDSRPAGCRGSFSLWLARVRRRTGRRAGDGIALALPLPAPCCLRNSASPPRTSPPVPKPCWGREQVATHHSSFLYFHTKRH